MLFHMAEYCDTPQSKERRNRGYKTCLNERAILRLLDHEVSRKSDVLQVKKLRPFEGLCHFLIFSIRGSFARHSSAFSGLPQAW